MKYSGSCHCGRITLEVEGELREVMECNCSLCRRRASLLWFVPRERVQLSTPAGNWTSYTFGSGSIAHHFCPVCGCAPFAEGVDESGQATAAINVRCLDGVDVAALNIQHFDGASV